MMIRPSARTTAQLILINKKLYEREREREITRHRFSLQTLRRISSRSALRQRFLSDLEDELAELGWLFISQGSEFAVLDLSKIDTWVKLSSKRLAEAAFLHADEAEVEEMYQKLFPPLTDESTDD